MMNVDAELFKLIQALGLNQGQTVEDLTSISIWLPPSLLI
jgi:hypothetical protein